MEFYDTYLKINNFCSSHYIYLLKKLLLVLFSFFALLFLILKKFIYFIKVLVNILNNTFLFILE